MKDNIRILSSGPSKMARRRYQKGTISKDGDRWTLRWREDIVIPAGMPVRTTDTVLPNGDILRRSHKRDWLSIKDYPTKRLAQRKLDQMLQEINREDFRPTVAITFEEFSGKWVDKVMIHHKPSSQSSERSHIKAHLNPTFGSYALKDISLEMIQEFVNNFEGSAKTIKNIITTLMIMWDTAKAWGYVTHNPFPRGTNGRLLLTLPRRTKPKTYAFTLDETLAIIARAEGKYNKWKLLFRTLAESGCRPGELAGMRKHDLQGRTIEIRQSSWNQELQDVKTSNSIRSFSISQKLANDLRDYIAKVEEDPESPRNPHDLIWTNNDGKPLSMDNFVKRVLNPILSDIGLRGQKVYKAGKEQRIITVERHQRGCTISLECGHSMYVNVRRPQEETWTCMSCKYDPEYIPGKLDELGIDRCGNYAFRRMNGTVMDRLLKTPLKTRQKRFGHASIETTLTHYTEAVDADDVQAAEQLGSLLDPDSDGASVQ
jgi:integrase